jgi:hypothetical protein
VPTIQFAALPPGVWQHLRRRALECEITLADLIRLDAWKQSKPEAPEGEWYKDFGSFKLCGDGALPKTFLLGGQVARGRELD